MKISLAAAVLLAAVAAGCGGGTERISEPATSAPVSTSAATSRSPTSSEIELAAPCGAADILPALRHRIGPQIVRTEIVRCRNDFARVKAVPDTSVCPPNCYQEYEAFVRWTGERWRVVDFGTGIECEDTTSLPPFPAPIRHACVALGYRQPTILTAPRFRMPSRNIGCALSEGVLRCDALSGLRPEPAKPCELDWVGIVLPPEGPATPNCTGDTIYDPRAPTLAYGEMWHGRAFWCESQPSGLLCVNPHSERGSFLLSRAHWEGG
jgi:hypothetical protein